MRAMNLLGIEAFPSASTTSLALVAQLGHQETTMDGPFSYALDLRTNAAALSSGKEIGFMTQSNLKTAPERLQL
jgi:hypothetical protein